MRKASLPAIDVIEPAAVERPLRRRRIRWQACPSRTRTAEVQPHLSLSTRAIACLVQRMPKPRRRERDGDVEDLLMFGGQLSPERLLRIAAGSSRAELLAMRGIGRGTIDEIEQWLDGHGHAFPPDADGLTAALGRAITHLETLIEPHDDVAYLQAFLALPDLKRALRTAPGKRIVLRGTRRAPATSEPLIARLDSKA